jgi:hypothetical protein
MMTPITFKGKTYNSEFEMPQDIRQSYQEVQMRKMSTKTLTDELYRQSAPADMRHLPSDESVYRPSAPMIDPKYSIIEPESNLVIRGLVFGILWSLVLIGIVFLVIEFFRQIL